MASNKTFNLAPTALLTTLTTNILNPPAASGGVGAGSSGQYIILNHITIQNKSAGAATVSLWKGATGANTAGTEFLWTGVSIPANSSVEKYGKWRFDTTDFLVGGSNTLTALIITAEGEIGVAG